MSFLKASLVLVLLVITSLALGAIARNHNQNGSTLAGIEFPDHMSFNAVSSSVTSDCSLTTSKKYKQSESNSKTDDCDSDNDDDDDEEEGLNIASVLSLDPQKQAVKVQLNRHGVSEPKKSVISSTIRDLARIQTLHKRMTEKKNQSTVSRLKKTTDKKEKKKKSSGNQEKERISPVTTLPASYAGKQLMATLESGVGFGSGEYFMDVFIGTPPKHFSLILDTGSDLNWIQCVPCHDCFEQAGPYYDPKESTSFRNITCRDPRCQLVSSPDPPQPCKSDTQSCPYYYWYGDSSNTTGDFAVETFTVNLTTATTGKPEYRRVENVMFGCGHWNRGLFKGAAGLLGLGRGPLSFSSQLQSLYGHSFSYCLVDRNSDTNVSSKLIFGEDKGLLSHPELNFTAFVAGKENPVDTFYYVEIKSILVGGEVLNIPEGTWKLSQEGYGGTIIDSGTTLSYFQDPAYQVIKAAFLKKVNKDYKLTKIEDFPLDLCYNVSGVENLELPDFGILFSDGALWNFPVENYFIQVDPQEVVCLAFKNTSASALSIIGNYQQQNFHILYDTKNSRLGYAPMNCADV